MESIDLLLNMSSSTGGGSFGALGLGVGLYSALMVFVYLFAIVTVCLILYYFTGTDKKADKFFPNLMSQSLRTYSYVWIFLSSVVAFFGLATVFFWVFDNILPKSEGIFSTGKDAEWDVLVKGLVVLTFALLLIGFKVVLNRMVVKTSRIGSTVSTKVFVSFGMILFSIFFFVSGLSFLLNFVDYAKESDAGLDPLTWSVFFASMLLLGSYLTKAYIVLKKESK